MSHYPVGMNVGVNFGFNVGGPDMVAYQQRMMMRQSALEGAYMPVACPSPEEMMMYQGFYNGCLGHIQQLRFGVPFDPGLFAGMPPQPTWGGLTSGMPMQPTWGGLTSGMPMQAGGMDPAMSMMMSNLDPSIMQYVMASRQQTTMTIMMCIMMEQQMKMQQALLGMLQQNQNQIPMDQLRQMLGNRYNPSQQTTTQPRPDSTKTDTTKPDSTTKTESNKEAQKQEKPGETPAQEHARKLDDFAQRLRKEGNDVSKETIRHLAVKCGLKEDDATNLVTWLSEVDSVGTIDFTDKRVCDMLDIYVKAGKANGDMGTFASSLRDYADKLGNSDNLNPECYDALAKAAGSPEGAGALKDKIGGVSGWGGSGSYFGSDAMKNLLDAYKTTQPKPKPDDAAKTDATKEAKKQEKPAEKPAQDRARKLEDFAQRLRKEGNDVSKEKIKNLADECGLKGEDADNLITWLSEVDSVGTIDFTDKRVVDMLDIFVKAGKANGDMGTFASSLRDYADKLGNSDNLNPECYDALAKAAGSPEGTGALKDKIGGVSGWGGSGSYFGSDAMKNLLDAYKTTPAQTQAAPAQTPAAPPKTDSTKTDGTKTDATKEAKKQEKPAETPAQERARKLDDFAQRLRKEGNDVSKEKIKNLADECGLKGEDADNLITWLSEVDSVGTIDFTDKSVVDMLNIFVKAGKANGDMRTFASSLRDYADKLGNSDNLNPECYDALAKAAGSPEGTGALKDKIGGVSGWWGSGSNFGSDAMKNLLDAYSH
jgi:ribosomal protein S25